MLKKSFTSSSFSFLKSAFFLWIFLSIVIFVIIGCKQQNTEVVPSLISPTLPATSTATSTPMTEPLQAFPTIPPLPTSTPDLRVLTPSSVLLSFTNPKDIDPSLQNNLEKVGSITLLDASTPLLWESGWCAHSPQTLTENLQQIEFQYTINGKKIPLDAFSQADIQSEDKETTCKMNSLIIDGFQRGRYELVQRILFKQQINDGEETFPQGEKEISSLVFVSESQSLDNIPISHWSQIDANEILSFWNDQTIQDDYMKARIEKKEMGINIFFEEVYKTSVLRLPPTIKRISSPMYAELTFESTPQNGENCFGYFFGYEFNPMSFIEFDFCTNGEFSIQQFANENWETLVERQEIHFPVLQSKYRLGIRLDEGKATFFLNDELLSELSNVDTKGYLGAWVKAIKGSQVSISQPLIKLP